MRESIAIALLALPSLGRPLARLSAMPPLLLMLHGFAVGPRVEYAPA